MYKIIAANQAEYGPVSADQIRQWIAEGRVNAQTLAQAEGETGWKPMSQFPEFASSFAGATAPAGLGTTTPQPGSPAQASGLVAGPAIGLIVYGALILGFALLAMLLTMFSSESTFQSTGYPELDRILMDKKFGIIQQVLVIVLGGLTLFGGIKMKRLESYGLSITASILAMLPCSCCCFIGLPIGIWSLVVLNKPEVKAAFNR